mmetsp:Transcript_16526/g.40637  ORF Transcript_16526/g.40637 Transcript_16526/m.40637 type:complete len:372 (-) Transcript_16526:590-1705(-)
MRFGILLVIIGRLAFIVKLEVELGSAEVRASLLAAARQEEAVLHVRLPLARLHIVPTMQRSVDLVQRLREAGSIRRREEDVDLLLTAEAQHVDVETRGMAVKHEDDGALDLLLVKVLVEGLERVQPGCTRLVPLGSSTLEESRASRAELVEDRLAERLRGHVGGLPDDLEEWALAVKADERSQGDRHARLLRVLGDRPTLLPGARSRPRRRAVVHELRRLVSVEDALGKDDEAVLVHDADGFELRGEAVEVRLRGLTCASSRPLARCLCRSTLLERWVRRVEAHPEGLAYVASSALDLALPLMRLSAALIRLEGDFDGDAAFFAMRLRCFAKVHSTPRSIRPPGTCMPSACVLALVAGIRPALLVHGTDAG